MRREIVWPESTQKRSFAAAKAWVNLPVFAYAPFELLAIAKQKGTPADSIVAFAMTGTPGYTGLAAAGGDTMRIRGGSCYLCGRRCFSKRRTALLG